jgi:hypothetical protein
VAIYSRQRRGFEKMGIDLMQLPVSENGYKYVLVVVEYLTKYVFVEPLRTKSAQEVGEALMNRVFAHMGPPAELISDNGREFKNFFMEDVLKYFAVKHNWTLAYHPQANGMVERFNKTLASMLSKYVSEHQRDWDQYVHRLAAAYNSAEHASTGYSPYELMYGAAPRLPSQVSMDLWRAEKEVAEVRTAEQFRTELGRKMQESWQSALEAIERNQQMNVLYRDVSANAKVPEVGNHVLVYNPVVKPGQMGKLCRRWTGPYRVEKVFRDKCVRVSSLNGMTKKSVSLERVKECPSSWEQTIKTMGAKGAQKLLDVGPWQGAMASEGKVLEVIGKRTLTLDEDHPVIQYQLVWNQDGRRTTEWVDVSDIVEADLIYQYDAAIKSRESSAGADHQFSLAGKM